MTKVAKPPRRVVERIFISIARLHMTGRGGQGFLKHPWQQSGLESGRPQFWVTLMAANSLSGVTLPEMVAVTVTSPPDGAP